jgi:hypothetical protein
VFPSTFGLDRHELDAQTCRPDFAEAGRVLRAVRPSPRRKSHNELGKARPDVAACIPPDRATEIFTYLVSV